MAVGSVRYARDALTEHLDGLGRVRLVRPHFGLRFHGQKPIYTPVCPQIPPSNHYHLSSAPICPSYHQLICLLLSAMLAITVLQRFLSILLAPTPFADPFLSASSSFAPLQALIVTGTLATPLIPAVTATAVDVKEDPQETLVVTDMYETPRFYAPFPSLDPPPTLSVRF